MDNRYYFEKQYDNIIIIEGGEAQHLSRVRRCKVGDEIVAFNGDGFDYKLKIQEIQKDKVLCSIVSKTVNKAFKDKNIIVYLAMIKNDALTTAIDNLAELNVKQVKLFKSDFSVASIEEKKLDKLKNIAIQASKQCERADIMQISLVSKIDIEKEAKEIGNVFFAYENSENKVQSFNGDFAVIIGPEGGFSEEENKWFSSFAKNVSLGSTILRAEVACVVAVSTLKAVNCES